MITLNRDWAGQPVAVVAGGPSFAALDARLIGMARTRKGLRVIAVSDAVYPCWYADILYSCDAKWWKHHLPHLEDYPGRLIKLDVPGEKPLEGVEIIGDGGQTGFDRRPNFIRNGRSSTYQALHIAAHLGASNIIMVGLDMDGGPHWFGEHPPEVHRACGIRGTMIQNFVSIAAELKKREIRVVNASFTSKVHAFDHMSLSNWIEALEDR